MSASRFGLNGAKTSRRRIDWQISTSCSPICCFSGELVNPATRAPPRESEPDLPSPGTEARRVYWTVLTTRAVYAINWLNIGTIFSVMAVDFNQGPLGLGALTASFYLGVGLMQVPGGIIAARWGSKRIVVLGTMIASVAALASGLVPSFEEVVVLRFLVGSGMALVFGPALVLLTKALGRETSGLGVGMYNSAFDVGGFFAFFLWGILAADMGWRLSLVASGGLGVATGICVLLLVPSDGLRSDFSLKTSGLKRVIVNRKLIILGLGVLALSIGNGLVQSFMFYYLHQQLRLGLAESGLVASLIVVVPILSSPLLGVKVYDRIRKPKLLMITTDVLIAAALAIAAMGSVAVAVVCCVLGGIASGLGFTTGFAAARDSNPGEREYDSLAVAWVNCISLLGSFGPPLVFSYIADVLGYSLAWISGAALVLVFTLPLLLLEEGLRPKVA